jgi:hypothetical protein
MIAVICFPPLVLFFVGLFQLASARKDRLLVRCFRELEQAKGPMPSEGEPERGGDA